MLALGCFFASWALCVHACLGTRQQSASDVDGNATATEVFGVAVDVHDNHVSETSFCLNDKTTRSGRPASEHWRECRRRLAGGLLPSVLRAVGGRLHGKAQAAGPPPVELWMYRVATQPLYADPTDLQGVRAALASRNVGNGQGVAAFFEDLRQQEADLWVGGFQIRFDPNFMSNYYNCEKGKCQWRYLSGHGSQVGVCCTDVPEDLDVPGLRRAAKVPARQSNGDGRLQAGDYCLPPAAASELLEYCAGRGAACWASVPPVTDRVEIVRAIPSVKVDFEAVDRLGFSGFLESLRR